VNKAVFDHQLVADTGARRVKDNPLLPGEGFDELVLGEIGLGTVLNIVIEGEDGLRRVGHPLGTDGAELGQHGAGVVVGHDVRRSHRHHLPREHFRSLFETHRVRLNDFFSDRLCHSSSRALAGGL
jgi:hypothetical protein